MALPITVNGEPFELATTAITKALDKRMTQLEALILNNDEAIRLNKASIAEALAKIGAPHPLPEPPVIEGIVVGPDDDLQEAIMDAGSFHKIWLKDGIYRPFKPITGTRIEAQNHGAAVVRGSVAWSEGWTRHDDVWFKPFGIPFWQHPANKVHDDLSRGIPHRQSMLPHLLMFNDEAMIPVFNTSELQEGNFFFEGTSDNPVGIWAKFPGGVSPSGQDIRVATHQSIISADSNTDNVEIIGLKLSESASTKQKGAVNFPVESNGWRILHSLIEWSSCEGLVLRGDGHYLESVISNHHGMTGIAGYGLINSTLQSCEGSFNVWKPGVDTRWHGGNKFTNSSFNKILDFTSIWNNGAGLWWDISNVDNVTTIEEIAHALGFGVMIEHHTLGSEPRAAILSGGIIRNTRRIPGVSHFGSGLHIQRGVKNYLISHLHLQDNEDGAVYYKKTEEHGDLSGSIHFDSVTYEGNGNNNRWAVQGDMNRLPDTFANMPTPNFANWQ